MPTKKELELENKRLKELITRNDEIRDNAFLNATGQLRDEKQLLENVNINLARQVKEYRDLVQLYEKVINVITGRLLEAK
jgi:uncharacterized protein YktB (UPF0637 family)